jgi:hypothetical protein
MTHVWPVHVAPAEEDEAFTVPPVLGLAMPSTVTWRTKFAVQLTLEVGVIVRDLVAVPVQPVPPLQPAKRKLLFFVIDKVTLLPGSIWQVFPLQVALDALDDAVIVPPVLGFGVPLTVSRAD